MLEKKLNTILLLTWTGWFAAWPGFLTSSFTIFGTIRNARPIAELV